VATILEVIPLLGSLIVAVSMLASVLFAVWSFRRGQEAQLRAAEAQLQLLALSTLQHYLDLAVAHPRLASPGDDRPIDAGYAWFAAQALVTAQTLQALVGQQESWQRAIDSIVRQHRAYLRSGAFVCADFTPEFVRYLRTKVADLACAEA
jgi:hypothetical protein